MATARAGRIAFAAAEGRGTIDHGLRRRIGGRGAGAARGMAARRTSPAPPRRGGSRTVPLRGAPATGDDHASGPARGHGRSDVGHRPRDQSAAGGDPAQRGSGRADAGIRRGVARGFAADLRGHPPDRSPGRPDHRALARPPAEEGARNAAARRQRAHPRHGRPRRSRGPIERRAHRARPHPGAGSHPRRSDPSAAGVAERAAERDRSDEPDAAREPAAGGPHRRSVDHQVEISVRDGGHGIRAETVSQIFEPFYTTKGDGMGIGLSIGRTIVEAHGGRIAARNDADRGATVWVTLPLGEGG